MRRLVQKLNVLPVLRPPDGSGGEERLLLGDEQPEHQADPRRRPLPAEGHHAAGLRAGTRPPLTAPPVPALCLTALPVLQYMMVKEALRERANLLDIAPHLSAPLPIMLPVYK